jgi:predicted RNase H-like nuclease
MRAAGVDACKGGWFAVVLDPGRPAAGFQVSSLEALSAAVPDADGFAIDIPIGLPLHGYRDADLEARRVLGPRRSSVFFTPVRAALTAGSHAEASDASRRLTGKGVSRQAYALAPKILEAERWARDALAPVWEVHPEVSFTMMCGRPARWSKKSFAGMRERQRALDAAGILLDGLEEVSGDAAVDDVLDAAAVAWSAARLLRGEGASLPDPPDIDAETGRPVAIWV